MKKINSDEVVEIDDKINRGEELSEKEIQTLADLFVDTWDDLADPKITFKIEIETCTSNSQKPLKDE